MLIKIGSLYLTLGTFTYTANTREVYLHGSQVALPLIADEPVELERILDETIAAQKTIAEQVAAINQQQAELQAKAQEIAQYEQQLMQKAAQVDAAYAAMQQQKSPVILPPGFGKRGRG